MKKEFAIEIKITNMLFGWSWLFSYLCDAFVEGMLNRVMTEFNVVK
jgi:hypothetical protein